MSNDDSVRVINYGVLTWDEFVGKAANRSNAPTLAKTANVSMRSKKERASSAEVATDSLEEAVKLARFGWHEGAQAVKDCDALFAGVDALKGWDLDVNGFLPDVAAYITGDPECMWNLQPDTEARRAVRIAYPAGYPWTIPAALMLEYGKALAGLVRSLEAAGIGVSLVSMDLPSDGFIPSSAAIHAQAIVVKDLGEPLDADRVAFSGHPDFSRRLVWAIREQCEQRVRAGVGSKSYGFSKGNLRREVVEKVLDDAASLVLLPEPCSLPETATAAELFERFKAAVEEQVQAIAA